MNVLLFLIVLAATAFAKPAKLSHPLSLMRSSTGRINGGEDASPGEFPYQLIFQWEIIPGTTLQLCGATVLSETWAVTGGSCALELPPIGEYQVVAGITDLEEQSEYRQVISVAGTLVHPDYDPNLNGGVGPNDMSLLKLTAAIIFGEFVKPIALPSADSVFEGDAVFSAWGATDADGGLTPSVLQKAVVPLLTYEECKEAVDDIVDPLGVENPLDESSNVCTGSLEEGISACYGDGGSPLAQNGTLVGIGSWIFIPCGSGAPSIFSKVANFIDFIDANVDDLPK